MGDKTLATRLAQHLDKALAELKLKGIEPPLMWMVNRGGITILMPYDPAAGWKIGESREDYGTTGAMVRELERAGVQVPVEILFFTHASLDTPSTAQPVVRVRLSDGDAKLLPPAALPN